MRRTCFYCGNELYTTQERPCAPRGHQFSRDHILPKVRFTPIIRRMLVQGLFQNFRDSCARCNSNRADVGHCPGALAAARAVPGGVAKLRKLTPREATVPGIEPDSGQRTKSKTGKRAS